MTSHLIKRIYGHKSQFIEWFTKKYNCKKLVGFKTLDCVEAVIKEEKKIKKLKKQYKPTVYHPWK